ncbi:hypothetical protein FJY94_04410 [Candidatus Kaiserbacteria bacterium]|nr:hypothetical protein [Candidatus Kaiserbacteria bacterium]
MDIELPRGPSVFAAVVVLLVALIGLGIAVSPRGEHGRPVLLSPNVRAVEHYRRHALRWVGDWQALRNELHRVLEEEGELLAISTRAQRGFEQTIALAQEVEATEAPASLVGLHDQAAITSQAFVVASLAVARWVSAPTGENRQRALQTLTSADETLKSLEANEWLNQSR